MCSKGIGKYTEEIGNYYNCRFEAFLKNIQNLKKELAGEKRLRNILKTEHENQNVELKLATMRIAELDKELKDLKIAYEKRIAKFDKKLHEQIGIDASEAIRAIDANKCRKYEEFRNLCLLFAARAKHNAEELATEKENAENLKRQCEKLKRREQFANTLKRRRLK